MFKKMIVQNFECHIKTKVSLCDKTIITGRNDAGKSALIRALHWICFNSRNFSFHKDVRRGAKFCRVVLYVDDHKIERYRSKSLNCYYLDGKKYKAIGHKVPSVVSDILNLGPYNFQMQLDLPFWVSETPGIVSKRLNEIVDLSIMDYAIKSAADTVRKLKYEIKAHKELKAECEKEDFTGLDFLKNKWDEITKIKGGLIAISDKVSAISNIENQIETALIEEQKFSALSRAAAKCLKVMKLEHLYTEQTRKMYNCKVNMEKTSKIVSIASGRLERLRDVSDNLRNSEAILERFYAIVNPFSLEKEIQQTTRKEISKCQAFLKGKRCPVCRNRIT